MTLLDRLAAALFRDPVFPVSSQPVPSASVEAERISADELSALEEHWKAERDRAAEILGERPVNECVACNPNGGRRPETREGREGR